MTPDSMARLAATRDDVRVLLQDPIKAWITSPEFRKTDSHYRELLLIPLDLASAGFTVSVSKSDKGWRVRLLKPITQRESLDVSTNATSWVLALHQLSISTDSHITSIESRLRARLRSVVVHVPERIEA